MRGIFRSHVSASQPRSSAEWQSSPKTTCRASFYYEGISPLKGIKKLGMCVYDKIRDQADTRKRTERKHAPSEGSLGCRDRSSYPRGNLNASVKRSHYKVVVLLQPPPLRRLRA